MLQNARERALAKTTNRKQLETSSSPLNASRAAFFVENSIPKSVIVAPLQMHIQVEKFTPSRMLLLQSPLPNIRSSPWGMRTCYSRASSSGIFSYSAKPYYFLCTLLSFAFGNSFGIRPVGKLKILFCEGETRERRWGFQGLAKPESALTLLKLFKV